MKDEVWLLPLLECVAQRQGKHTWRAFIPSVGRLLVGPIRRLSGG